VQLLLHGIGLSIGSYDITSCCGWRRRCAATSWPRRVSSRRRCRGHTL